ncbi:kinesin-like protein KIF18A isoform X1 [Nilaparvata lugens]|nr:kinesin-like protein KIF18A isoform X1 [Nilaparvata lugens]
MLVFDPKEEEEQFFFRGVKQKMRDMTKKQPKEMGFLFDGVFNAEATNVDVYNRTTRSIISNLLEGYNCSVFVYGATGSGKTHTMLGSRENPGIMYHTMVELYAQIEKVKADKNFQVGVTFVEVYNENVHNLLNPSGPMHLRESATGVTIAGLKVEDIVNADHLLEKLAEGNRNRTQHPTDANAESSRSHAVFQVYVRMATKNGNQVKIVKLSMIDLAGSERGMVTGCSGLRFKEGANINKSLLALGNCICNLADGLKHIPYRDSKLTRLLKDSLGGNCHTIMIANVSPSVASYEDTYNTLKYATRAKNIKTKVTKNAMSVDLDVGHYVKMVEELKKEIVLLKSQTKAHSSARSFPPNSDLSVWCRALDEIFDERIEIMKSILTLECNQKLLALRKKRKLFMANLLKETPGSQAQGIEKVEEALRQYNARMEAMVSAQAEQRRCQKSSDEKLQKLFIEMEEARVTQDMVKEFEMRDEKLNRILTEVKLDYMKKAFMIDQKDSSTNMQSIKTLFESFTEFYNILSGMNWITDKMESTYQCSRNIIEGMKTIRWLDNEEEESDSTSGHVVNMTNFEIKIDHLLSFKDKTTKKKPISLSLDEEDDKDAAQAIFSEDFSKVVCEEVTPTSSCENKSSETKVFSTPTKMETDHKIEPIDEKEVEEICSTTFCVEQPSASLNETITLDSNKDLVKKPASIGKRIMKEKTSIITNKKVALKSNTGLGINKENQSIQKIFKKPLPTARKALSLKPVNVRAMESTNLAIQKPKLIKSTLMNLARSKTGIVSRNPVRKPTILRP